jgi:hypothetical protein
MSKAYLLAICLLATTLTGCLADDNETTEQKISPVGDEGDQNGGNVTTYSPESNITIRYDSQNYFANFSKSGNTVHVNFSGESFTAFIWFYDYDGNEIRHNRLYQGYDNCYSNGNWSAWDSNGSADCIEQYAIDPESVIWEFNLARTPMSVGIGQEHLYYLESF